MIGATTLPLLVAFSLIAVDLRAAVGLIHASALSGLAARFLWNKNYFPHKVASRVELEAGALVIDGKRFTRADVRAGFVSPTPTGPVLRLERPGLAPAIELELDDAADGRAALTALGLDPSHTVTAFRGLSLVHGNILRSLGLMALIATIGSVVGAVVATAAGPLGVPVGFLTATFGMMAGFLWPTSIEVGADGVLIRWLAYQRFVPHREIVAAHSAERGSGRGRHIALVLSLDDGSELAVPLETKFWSRDTGARAAQRVHEAKAVHDRGGASFDAHVLLRKDKSGDDWVRSLRELTRIGKYRSGSVRAEELWRIVESPAAEPLTRAAAAVALEPVLREPERARLRIAAAATAQPRLRIALDALADGAEDPAIVEALAELEQSTAEQRE